MQAHPFPYAHAHAQMHTAARRWASHLGIVFVAAIDDFRRHVDGRANACGCGGVELMLGVAKIADLQQWAPAIVVVPVKQEVFQLQVAICHPLQGHDSNSTHSLVIWLQARGIPT